MNLYKTIFSIAVYIASYSFSYIRILLSQHTMLCLSWALDWLLKSNLTSTLTFAVISTKWSLHS